jgi:Na+-transporting NADH:ubiquinone oxidoreductase subunit NqrC
MENQDQKKDKSNDTLNKTQLIRIGVIGVVIFIIMMVILQINSYTNKEKEKEITDKIGIIIEKRKQEEIDRQKKLDYQEITISKDSCKLIVKQKFERMFTKKNKGMKKYYELNKIKKGEYKVHDIQLDYYGNSAKGVVFGIQSIDFDGEIINNEINFEFVLTQNLDSLRLVRWGLYNNGDT